MGSIGIAASRVVGSNLFDVLGLLEPTALLVLPLAHEPARILMGLDGDLLVALRRLHAQQAQLVQIARSTQRRLSSR